MTACASPSTSTTWWLALRLADQLQPWFGVAKVGLELFTAAGPDAVTSIADAGFKVFLDLKLHDIPTTVKQVGPGGGGAGRVLPHAARPGRRGDAAGGRRRVAGGGRRRRAAEPTALAVTILTSDADAPAHILGGRVAAAVESGCGGVIVAAADVHEAKQLAPRLLAVVPGIRLPSGDPHDQARAATPRDAFLVGRRHARHRPGRHRRRRPPGRGRRPPRRHRRRRRRFMTTYMLL